MPPILRRAWFVDHSPGVGVFIAATNPICTFSVAPITLGTLPGANDLGSGQLSAAWGSSTDGSIIVGFGADAAGKIHALSYSGGIVTDLGGLAGFTLSDCFGCSGNGNIIVGRSKVAGIDTGTVWTAGTPAALSFLPGGTDSFANYCSSDGSIVVGFSTVAGIRHAVFWTNGVITDLGTTGGNTLASGCSADGSVVVGSGVVGINELATSWTNGGAAVFLGELPGDDHSRALKCNAAGTIIVGKSFTSGGAQTAVYWDNTGVHALSDFYGGSNNIATGISSNGTLISGYGSDGSNQFFWPLVWRNTVQSVMRIGDSTGAELITNGTFTGSAAGWTLGNNVTYGGNAVTSLYAGGVPLLTQAGISTTSGHIYEILFTISGAAPAGAGAVAYFLHNTFSSPAAFYTNGTYSLIFEADFTGADTITFDDANYNIGDTWTLDDVSMKELTATVQPSINLEVLGISPDGEVIMGQGAYNPGPLKAGAIKWLCV